MTNPTKSPPDSGNASAGPSGSTVFDTPPEERRLSLPWSRTFSMCWQNILVRIGRFALVFISIAVVVAFFVNTLTYNGMLRELRRSEVVHTRAVLEQAGVLSNSPDAAQREHDQLIWMLGLSGILCFSVVVNTMLMSVTERYREIGTLKCLGAVDSFVVRLFLIESLLLGLFASATGALFGYVLAILQVMISLEPGLLVEARPLRFLLIGFPAAVGIGTVVTVLAAAYPTLVAARMKPVDAMRVQV